MVMLYSVHVDVGIRKYVFVALINSYGYEVASLGV